MVLQHEVWEPHRHEGFQEESCEVRRQAKEYEAAISGSQDPRVFFSEFVILLVAVIHKFHLCGFLAAYSKMSALV